MISVVDIVEQKIILPGGDWPSNPKLKRCGIYIQEAFHDGLRGVAYEPLAKTGMSPDQIERMTIEAQESMLDPSLRWFWPM
jgi:hypothetical protein